MRNFCLALVAAATVFVSACGDEPAVSSGARSESQHITPAPHVAWLSKRLPESTIGYVRLPMLWDAFLRQSENALNNPQAMAVHTQQIETIRAGLSTNIWQKLPPQAQAPLTVLFDQVESPLEVAFLLPPDGSFVPNFLLGTTLALNDGQSFSQLLDALVASTDQMRVLTPLDDRGFATLFAGPLPLYLHYESTTSRLRVLSGASATQNFLEQSLADKERPSRLADLESGLDASGRGLSAWVDVAALWPMASPMLPPEQLAVAQAAGLDDLRGIWMGSVARDGHSQLRLQLDMPATSGFRKLLPVPTGSVAVAARGTPRMVFKFGLPSRQELVAATDFVLALAPDGAETRSEIDQALAKFRDWLGVDAGLLLDGYGPGVVLVNDESGMWGAYQVRDRKAAQQFTDALVAKAGTSPDARSIGGMTYHSWTLPSLISMSDEWKTATVTDAIPQVALDLLGRLGSHLYWVDEDDFQIAASVPQVLMARNNRDADTDTGRWLQRTMGIDARDSVMLLAMRNDDGARNVYHYYLALLQFLADVAGVTIDPFAMPPWDEAGLPAGGGVALGLESSAESLSLHFNYQYSPVEMVLGTDTLTAVAVAGILAAIAIPAYQDYGVRAEVAEVAVELSLARAIITAHWVDEGRYPTAEDMAEVVASFTAGELEYDPESGTLTVYFAHRAPALADRYLQVSPYDNDGEIAFDCESDLDYKHLPAECRD